MFCEGLDHNATTAVELVEGLTTMRSKEWFFARDPYFRDSWRDFRADFGERAREWARRFSFVLFKPDAIVTRSIGHTVRCLEEHGFEPIYHSSFCFDRFLVRELWRYTLNRATDQRFDAIDLLLPATESLVLIVRDNELINGDSAAARLKRLKGPSKSEARTAYDLRSRIGAGTGLLNFIHTPDEPADVVREIGVLFDPRGRRSVLDAVGATIKMGARFDLGLVEARIYRGVPVSDLNVLACAARIEQLAEMLLDPATRAMVLDACAAMRSHAPCDWQRILQALDCVALSVDPWDRIIFAATCTRCDLDGVAPLVES